MTKDVYIAQILQIMCARSYSVRVYGFYLVLSNDDDDAAAVANASLRNVSYCEPGSVSVKRFALS